MKGKVEKYYEVQLNQPLELHGYLKGLNAFLRRPFLVDYFGIPKKGVTRRHLSSDNARKLALELERQNPGCKAVILPEQKHN